ncbi:MAG: Ppx/GppA family phosphatase [Propionibacteriaceae bacterium]|jgi:exopolyphosphatase/guanosine-5'-triphosphate,3'-diphosphate pyrophosphatase|nr:Ppx/GppA family phosphatase [Propionibacteriaceae bacterium]
MAQLFAAVDCGTNSVRLLVVDADGREIERRLHITRLGQGVDATGEFAPEALQRTFAAFDDFGAQLRGLGGAVTRVVATSAARDARNAAEFFAGARRAFGVDAEIISGAEEAALSFAGATAGLPGAVKPLVMDVGGGSTELVCPPLAVSLDMGSVRVRERFLGSDPPTIAQVEAASEFINSLLDTVTFEAETWVGVGGTATCLAAIAQRLPAYDRTRVHGYVMPPDVLDDLAQDLLRMTVAEVKALPSMEPGRADVICAGALICREVGARTNLPLTVSESDILDGIVARLRQSQA